MNHELAFPNVHNIGIEGLSIRDYFAIRCLAAIINADTSSSSQSTQRDQCRNAYAYAEALIEARGK